MLPTILISLLIAGLLALALRRTRKKGACDCASCDCADSCPSRQAQGNR